jgi:chemotaxis protein MotB
VAIPLSSRTKAHAEDDGESFWLITYCDMVTLLLTFFLLMFSFTVMTEEQQQDLVGLLNKVSESKTVDQAAKLELEKAAQEIAAQFDRKDTFVESSEEEITVGLSSAVTFASGDAALSDAARQPLERVAEILAKLPNTVRVEGHTDDVPIQSVRFPSNWHLSAARAQSVVRMLIDRGVEPRRLQNVGYAETRPRRPNDTPEHRAENRRIEIKIIRDRGAEAAAR